MSSLHFVVGHSSGKSALIEAAAKVLSSAPKRCVFAIFVVDGLRQEMGTPIDKMLHGFVPRDRNQVARFDCCHVVDSTPSGCDIVGWVEKSCGVVVIVVDSCERLCSVLLCVGECQSSGALKAFDYVDVFAAGDDFGELLSCASWWSSNEQRRSKSWLLSVTSCEEESCSESEVGVLLRCVVLKASLDEEAILFRLQARDAETLPNVQRWLAQCTQSASNFSDYLGSLSDDDHCLPGANIMVMNLTSSAPMSFFRVQRFFESLRDEHKSFLSAKAVVVVPNMATRVIHVSLCAGIDSTRSPPRCSGFLASNFTGLESRACVTFQHASYHICRVSLQAAFEQCAAEQNLSFAVGELVATNIGEWVVGRVTKHWDEGNAYRIRVFGNDGEGSDVWAPIESKSFVRREIDSLPWKLWNPCSYSVSREECGTSIVLPPGVKVPNHLYQAMKSQDECSETDFNSTNILLSGDERTCQVDSDLLSERLVQMSLNTQSSAVELYRKLLNCDKDTLNKVSVSLASTLPKGCGVRDHWQPREDDTQTMAARIVTQASRCGCDDVVSSFPTESAKFAQLLFAAKFDGSALCEQCPMQKLAHRPQINGSDLISLCAFLRIPLAAVLRCEPDLARGLTAQEAIKISPLLVKLITDRILVIGFYCLAQKIPLRYLRKLLEQLQLQSLNDHKSVCDCREKMGLCSSCVDLLDNTLEQAFNIEGVRLKLWKSASRVSFAFNTSLCHSHTFASVSETGSKSFVSLFVDNIAAIYFNPRAMFFSPEFCVNGHYWRILLLNSEGCLGVFLCTAKKKLRSACRVGIQMWIVNQMGRDYSKYHETQAEFSANAANQQWGFNKAALFDQLLDKQHTEFLMRSDSGSQRLQIDIALTQRTLKSEGERQNDKGKKVAGAEIARNISDLLNYDQRKKIEKKFAALIAIECSFRTKLSDEALAAGKDLRRKFGVEEAAVRRKIAADALKEEQRVKNLKTEMELRVSLGEAIAALTTELEQLESDIADVASALEETKNSNSSARETLGQLDKIIDEEIAHHIDQRKEIFRSRAKLRLCREEHNDSHDESEHDLESCPLTRYLKELEIRAVPQVGTDVNIWA